jgi:hypothetical protein
MLADSELAHLSGSVERVSGQLANQWLPHVERLKWN